MTEEKEVKSMSKKMLSEKEIEKLQEQSTIFDVLKDEISKVIVGNNDIISFAIIAILCGGHILLEGVPGVAKTTLIKTITKALGLDFKRIQFTPDLLPADLIGTLIYNQKTQEFETKKGPIFANLILADEINRAPAKVQAALLEAMQEKQVTIGSETYKIDEPFLVFATQNPIEQEGTYRLPEAQVDRFMFKLIINYLTAEKEKEILTRNITSENIQQVMTKKEILLAQEQTKSIYVSEKIVEYIINIVFATRTPKNLGLEKIAPFVQYGASPRATLAIYHASQANAFLNKRYFVIPDDIKTVAPAIMRHRLLLSYEAEAEGIKPESIIQEILLNIKSP